MITLCADKFGARPHPKPGVGATALALILSLGLIASGCYNDPESRLAEIRAIQAGGRFQESVKPLRVLLTAEPEHEEANYRLGVALVQTGRASLALWPLMKAQNGDEFGTQAGLLLTATLISQQSYEEAIRAVDRVVAREPDNLAARYARGAALIGGTRPADAIQDAEHVLSIKPGDAHAYAIKMSALLDLKRFDEAEASQIELVKITEAGPNADQAARACGVLARFYADQGDNAKSQATHESCLEKYPEHPMVRAWSSGFYTLTGQPDKAIEIWQIAVDANPEDFELRTNLADLLSDAGRKDEAEKVLETAAELFDTARAYQSLSHAYMVNDKPVLAREALQTALSRTKNEPDVLRFTVGDLFIEEGDLESAAEVAKSLKEPSYRHLLNGAIALARGNPEGALVDFDKGLRLWPNNARARYLAGIAAQGTGNIDRATTEFRESVRVSETETDASLALARIYYTFGQYATARQFAARQIKNRPLTSADAHLIDARSAAAMGDMDAAFRGLALLNKTIFAASGIAERASLVRKNSGVDSAIKVIEESDLDLTDLSNIVAVRVYADLLIAAERTNDAIKAAGALLDNNADSAEAMEAKGRVLILAGKNTEAGTLINAALENEPEYAAALQAKAMLTAKAGDLDGALSYYDRASAAEDNDPNYAYQAAQLVISQGKTDEGIERLKKIVKHEPGHIGANNDLAWYLAESDSELDFALELAKRAADQQTDADTLDTLGWVQYKLDMNDDAIATFNKALALRPDSASIRYRLGLALAKAGSSDQARAALEQAIGGSAFPELSEAKAELARLGGS